MFIVKSLPGFRNYRCYLHLLPPNHVQLKLFYSWTQQQVARAIPDVDNLSTAWGSYWEHLYSCCGRPFITWRFQDICWLYHPKLVAWELSIQSKINVFFRIFHLPKTLPYLYSNFCCLRQTLVLSIAQFSIKFDIHHQKYSIILSTVFEILHLTVPMLHWRDQLS